MLSPEAESVYDVLAARGELADYAIAGACALDVDTVGSALVELGDAGLVVVRPGGGTEITLSGEAALHGLLRDQPATITRSLLDARRALDQVLGTPEPEAAGLERVTDLGALLKRLGAAMAATQREVLNLHAGAVPTQAELDGAYDEDLALLGRGVALRTVCPQYFIEEERWRTYVEIMGEHGAITRFADGVPHRMLVFDRELAVVPIIPQQPRAGAVFVKDPAVVRALHQLGTTILRSSRALAEAVASTERPSELDRKVLLLMSAGLTDAVSASRLSVTERQFRRYVASLMTRLGVQSRFQAGVRAVERGWL